MVNKRACAATGYDPNQQMGKLRPGVERGVVEASYSWESQAQGENGLGSSSEKGVQA